MINLALLRGEPQGWRKYGKGKVCGGLCAEAMEGDRDEELHGSMMHSAFLCVLMVFLLRRMVRINGPFYRDILPVSLRGFGGAYGSRPR